LKITDQHGGVLREGTASVNAAFGRRHLRCSALGLRNWLSLSSFSRKAGFSQTAGSEKQELRRLLIRNHGLHFI